jgi:hypothetical protein
VWVDTASPRLPAWLRPFAGQALVVFDDHGQYLVAQAPRRILDQDRFPTYLHTFDNAASSRVAAAAA